MNPWTRPGITRVAAFSLTLAAFAAAQPGLAHSQGLPPDEAGAVAHLDASPRHGEWVDYDAGAGDMVRAWVVYPERADAAPVVVVIHEIYALTDWIRSVADQLAAEGFIAIAPDLLSGKAPGGGGSESLDQQGAVALIRTLEPEEVTRRLKAAASYATALPSATTSVGVVGYCWGGSTSFRMATEWPGLGAAVVYYGSSPATETLGAVDTPILGLYGGNDARVNATIPEAQAALEGMGKSYEVHIFEGAGHGFLRQQPGQEGANLEATRAAWPRTVAFFKEHLGG
ncbi:MAG: dienelactone hydrolase family protein [Longimicrobiales bacterium]|nr:dienelactone hydrolase family protein [Longimicrobiales bacterium]